jgi:hypothetical protein
LALKCDDAEGWHLLRDADSTALDALADRFFCAESR